MQPIRTILVPTDFSPGSQRAIDEALGLARVFDASITLFHVEMPPVYAYTDAPILGVDLLGEIRGRAKAAIDQSATELERQLDRPVVRKVALGAAPHEIVEEAKQGNYDLIVISTHGYTGVKHFFLGSTAERVIQLAPCRVLTVRGPE